MELALDLTKRYTYADYLTWLDDKRRELIDGFIHLMSPAPSSVHQNIISNINGIVWRYLFDNNCACKIYPSPFDVRFPKDSREDIKIHTVVQPDICIICDPSKVDEKGCLGAPDMIVEVISPKTYKRDLREKYILYEKHGVKEYWIISPKSKSIVVYILQSDGQYSDGEEYISGEKIPVFILNGLEIDTNLVFR
jgi:Uma2 family endonuclease